MPHIREKLHRHTLTSKVGCSSTECQGLLPETQAPFPSCIWFQQEMPRILHRVYRCMEGSYCKLSPFGSCMVSRSSCFLTLLKWRSFPALWGPARTSLPRHGMRPSLPLNGQSADPIRRRILPRKFPRHKVSCNNQFASFSHWDDVTLPGLGAVIEKNTEKNWKRRTYKEHSCLRLLYYVVMEIWVRQQLSKPIKFLLCWTHVAPDIHWECAMTHQKDGKYIYMYI